MANETPLGPTPTRFCPLCDARTPSRVCPRDGLPTVPEMQLGDMAPDRPGRVVNGRYRLVAAIAEGAMGQVYQARQLDVARDVALKILKPELTRDRRAVQRFYREARIASELVGPHFVETYDFGFDEDVGAPFIAMELLPDRTLADLAPMSPRPAAALLGQVASALAQAERCGIVHRDLKAANVLVSLDSAGRALAKVTDFGVAKDLMSVDATLTRTGEPVGTPSCMAPEQIEGGEVDARTDLYALGCLLHRLLSGSRVFGANDLAMLMQQHLSEPPPRLPVLLPSGVPAPVPLVVLRDALLAKRPAARPASALPLIDVFRLVAEGEDHEALVLLSTLGLRPRDALDGDTWRPSGEPPAHAPLVAPTVPPEPRVQPKARNRGQLIGAAIAIAIGAGVAGVVLSSLGATADQPAAKGRALRPLTSVPIPSLVPDGDVIVVSPTAAAPIAVDAQDSDAHPAETTATDPEPVALRVESQPPAWLHRDGERLGRTPYILALIAGQPPIELELRRAGYLRRRIAVSAQDPSPHVVRLEPAPSASPSDESDPLPSTDHWRPKPF